MNEIEPSLSLAIGERGRALAVLLAACSAEILGSWAEKNRTGSRRRPSWTRAMSRLVRLCCRAYR